MSFLVNYLVARLNQVSEPGIIYLVIIGGCFLLIGESPINRHK
jgi:hypothetical protein